VYTRTDAECARGVLELLPQRPAADDEQLGSRVVALDAGERLYQRQQAFFRRKTATVPITTAPSPNGCSRERGAGRNTFVSMPL
jgi:hypothetical protein